MSLVALPAIGEDTRTHAELGALLDALRARGDTLPGSVQDAAAGGGALLPRIPVRGSGVVRRRFHSSDLVLRRPADSPGGGGGSLRRVALSKATAVAAVDADLLWRRRRTLSETHVPLAALVDGEPQHSYQQDEELEEEEEDEEDGSSSCRDDEELKRLLTKARRGASDVDHCSASSASSMYSSPASTPHSRSFSFATDHEAAESLDKLRNLQKLYQEGFITVTEYKDRRLQLADELGIPERSAFVGLDGVRCLLSRTKRLTALLSAGGGELGTSQRSRRRRT